MYIEMYTVVWAYYIGLVSCIKSFCVNHDIVTCAGGCEADSYLGYTWSETLLGSYATSTCPQCKDVLGSLAGLVLRYCVGTLSQGAVWSDELDFNNCATSKSNITTRLCDIAMVNK